MTRALLALALSGCVVANTAAHRKPPLAAYLADFAAFGAGLAATVDGYNRQDSTQAIIGGTVAAVMWLPWFLLPSSWVPR